MITFFAATIPTTKACMSVMEDDFPGSINYTSSGDVEDLANGQFVSDEDTTIIIVELSSPFDVVSVGLESATNVDEYSVTVSSNGAVVGETKSNGAEAAVFDDRTTGNKIEVIISASNKGQVVTFTNIRICLDNGKFLVAIKNKLLSVFTFLIQFGLIPHNAVCRLQLVM